MRRKLTPKLTQGDTESVHGFAMHRHCVSSMPFRCNWEVVAMSLPVGMNRTAVSAITGTRGYFPQWCRHLIAAGVKPLVKEDMAEENHGR